MEILLVCCILVIAFLYASVGHGGASGYLAVMALFSISPLLLKPTALILNVLVSAIAFYNFGKAGYFRFKLLWPFIVGSVPFAFLGAKTNLDPKVYKILLAIALLIAIARLLFSIKKEEKLIVKIPILQALFFGAIIGMFSGLIGIGGGIILSPLILLKNWATFKEAAEISAAFIFLNSLSGLSAISLSIQKLPPEISVWIMVALVGGIFGSYAGSTRIPLKTLRIILSAVLLFACIKLVLV